VIAAMLSPARGLVLAAIASLLILVPIVDTVAPRSRPWCELDVYVAFVDAAAKVEQALLQEQYRVLTNQIWDLRIFVRNTHEPRAEQELRRLVELRDPIQRYLYPGGVPRFGRHHWFDVCRANPLAKGCM
jgi:hypothetical protein